MVEKLIQSVIMAMQDSLDDEQLRMLENVLALNLHGMEIKEECTQLVTSERHWEKILRMYIASKRLENCAESTLIAYRRCITMLFEGINKKITRSQLMISDIIWPYIRNREKFLWRIWKHSDII